MEDLVHQILTVSKGMGNSNTIADSVETIRKRIGVSSLMVRARRAMTSMVISRLITPCPCQATEIPESHEKERGLAKETTPKMATTAEEAGSNHPHPRHRGEAIR